MTITQKQYSVLDAAYSFFNKKLFEGKLPDCMIILQRKGKRNMGHFHASRFVAKEDLRAKKKNKLFVDEIALHPDNCLLQSDTAILSTLVHEMVHSWQRHCVEKQPRSGYHDKVWATKMEEIGLMPSNTGEEGGKKTGQQMDHYILPSGKFEKAALHFLKKNKIDFTSFPLPASAKSSSKNKVKYSCESCGQNAWAKPEASLICGECQEDMVPA